MDNQRLLKYAFVFAISLISIIAASYFFDALSRYIQVISLFGAASGLIKLIYESNKTRKLKEAEFISELNRDFTTNQHICSLYEKLEMDYRYPDKPSTISEKDVVSFVIYFTFFETLHDFVKKGIVEMENVDDLFGYRFFIMVHNPTIQSIELTNPKLIGSYVNIFKLYNVWLNHRIKKLKRTHFKIKDTIVLWENNLFENHPECKIFLNKKIEPTTFVNAEKKDLSEIIKIQKRVVRYLPKDKPEIFYPSTTDELLLMIKNNTLKILHSEWGIKGYIGYQPAEGHFDPKITESLFQPVALLDTVCVDIEYRGLGLQSFMTQQLLLELKNLEYKSVIVTVSPENNYSIDNLKKCGFELLVDNILLYGGKKRQIYSFKIT